MQFAWVQLGTRGFDAFKPVRQGPVRMGRHQWSSVFEDEFVKDTLLALNSSGFSHDTEELRPSQGTQTKLPMKMGHISPRNQKEKL